VIVCVCVYLGMRAHSPSYLPTPRVSMGVVGVKSTAGRAVKCVDPSKTTRSESAWLGYPFCDKIDVYGKLIHGKCICMCIACVRVSCMLSQCSHITCIHIYVYSNIYIKQDQ